MHEQWPMYTVNEMLFCLKFYTVGLFCWFAYLVPNPADVFLFSLFAAVDTCG